MSEPVSVVLVGIGGYGEVYLTPLLEDPRGARCRIAGAVDPRPESCSRLPALRKMGIPVFPSLEAFYHRETAELAVLSSPIQLHAPHTCLALENGCHVLVEKPAAAVTADVDRMIAARKGANRFVAVGFQWSFADSVLDLKRDILKGRFGRPLWGRSLTLWPRTEAYYQRNDWAGRRRDPGGRWILDSPASNAMAHHLHNLLFLLGPALDRSTEAVAVEARLARVNEIETFDTIGARVGTSSGAELLFLASHAIGPQEAAGPRFTLAFEKGELAFPGGLAPMTFRFHDGTTRSYPSPDASSQVKKLWDCLAAAGRWRNTGEPPKDGEDRHPAWSSPGASKDWRGVPPCGLETARPHTAFVETLEQAGVEVATFRPESVRIQETEDGRLRSLPGLAAALEESFARGTLPEYPGGAS
jgi:predicted dehydrogenase